MLKPFILLAALFAAFASTAQNIVVNPDFEQYISCPNNTSQISKCAGWQNVGLGTADYFNACATYAAGVPLNALGYQSSGSGDGHAGLYAFSALAPNFREYIKGHLVNMQAGQSYQVSIKVSLSGIQKYAVDGLGILFTYDSTYMLSSNATQPFTPQVDFTIAGPLTDTTNWITLTDTFYADSAYRHFVIGGFKPDSLLEIDTLASGIVNASYYYIDDVSVVPVTLGISEQKGGGIANIYPHPIMSSSEVIFDNTGQSSYTFNLYNAHGQLVRRITDIRSGKFTINKGDLVTGLYFYTLGGGTKRYSGKVMIE